MKNLIKIAIFSLIIAIFTSCKTKEIVTEKVIKVSDSTEVLKLQKQITSKDSAILVLTSKVSELKTENTKLQSQTNTSHTEYDSDKPIVPGTNKPPVKSETNTTNVSVYENTINSQKTTIDSISKENNSLKSENLEQNKEINSLKSENTELKSKKKSGSGLPWYWLVIAGVGGFFLGIFRKQIWYLVKKII